MFTESKCLLRDNSLCHLMQQTSPFLSFKLPQQPITNCTLENRKSLKHFRNIFQGVGFWFLLYTITISKRGGYMCQKHGRLEMAGKGTFTPICTMQLDTLCCRLLMNPSAASCAVIKAARLVWGRQPLVLGRHYFSSRDGLSKELPDSYASIQPHCQHASFRFPSHCSQFL